VIRKVEVEVEAALDKLRGAAKELQKGIRDAVKKVTEEQKELATYVDGELCVAQWRAFRSRG
jgi:soluble cytochrome b562